MTTVLFTYLKVFQDNVPLLVAFLAPQPTDRLAHTLLVLTSCHQLCARTFYAIKLALLLFYYII